MMWTLYVRAPDLTRDSQIDDYLSFEAVPRFNSVGTWVLEIDRRAPAAEKLLQPQWGVEVVRDGTTVFAGPMTGRNRKRSDGTNLVTVSGVDDNVRLGDAQAHPQPGTSAPPYSSSEFDVRSGQCSAVLRAYVDVNIGPGALSSRKVSGLSLGSDPEVGSTVTGRARWQPLLELLQSLALSGGRLGFRVQQVGSGLEFRVYQPADKTNTVVFSEELGNLADYELEEAASEVNYVYLGGDGEGTSRIIREGQDSADVVRWGRRIERFVDQRSSSDSVELDQHIAEELEEGVGKTSLTFTPVDTGSLRYLVDYQLGDQATAVIDGEPFEEIIQSTRILLTEETQQVLPSMEPPGRADALRIFKRLTDLGRRVRNLERR